MSRAPFLAELQDAIAKGSTNAEETVKDSLTRIAKHDAKLHAFVEINAERALEEARHQDRLAALGQPRAPLSGIAIGIKDLIDVAGFPTKAGSLTRQDSPRVLHDAPIVARLKAQGAIIVGKTATVEYAFGGWGTNVTLGTPHNPWDMLHARVPGGSSSGSGVSVAAGLLPAALGSDTGGSIRLPASFSGLVGLKTTVGLIDKSGVLPLVDELDTLGPMTRSSLDAAILFDAMTGQHSAKALRALDRERPFANLRIGLPKDLGVTLDPDTRRVYDEAIALLEAGGAQLVDLDLGKSISDFAAPCGLFLAVESYAHYGQFVDAVPSLIGEPVRERMLGGKALSAPEFLNHQVRRKQEIAKMVHVFEQIDAIFLPATAMPAPRLDNYPEQSSPGVFTRLANYCDLAAIALPMGLSKDKLPVGMQIIVPAFKEERALSIAHGLETLNGGAILCPVHTV
jgi:aspartyl-tRNA(Asn)/glutamyl-tRNA(Gln) amidotransferase subunit A